MNLLYVGMDSAPYSGRSHEVLVAEEFCRQGHDVTLVVERQPRWTPESPQPKNLNVLVAAVNNPKMAETIGRALKGDFDAAFASSVSGAPILAAWKAAHQNAPAVVNRRVVAQVLDVPRWRIEMGPDMPWFTPWRAWFDGLVKMDHLVVNTMQTQEDLLAVAAMYQNGQPDIPGTSVVYYGIDTETADLAVARDLMSPDLAGSVPAWCVGVSRLVNYKGFDAAIMALSLLPEKQRPAYVIVGVGEDMERLVHLASLTKVSVALTGGVPDLDKFEIIKGSSFGLFLAFNPHIPAQFPMECVYSGRPVVVADIAINRERFTEETWMVAYVDPFDTRAVAEAVASAMSVPPPDEKVVERARAWIRENRSFESHARGILEVLGASS